MNPIAIKDHDTGAMVPIGDVADWSLQSQLMTTAVFNHGWLQHRVSIQDARRCGLWKLEYDSLPEIPTISGDNEDAQQIVENGDRTL